MLLHKGLTHIQSQIKPWLLFGKSFTLSCNGVCPKFPIKGVAFVMGNDLVGGKVLVTPDVPLVSVRQCPDALAQVDPKSRSETNEAFVACGALSGAEVAPLSVTLVQGKSQMPVSQHLS